MNNLQKLIKLRGLSASAIAERIGAGYHITQKTIKGVRQTYHIQASVARLLGLTYDEAWGDSADHVLRELIRREVKKLSKEEGKKQLRRWLQDGNVPKKRAAGNA